MFFFKFFSKPKPDKKKNYHKINPDEFILISEHLINSYSITHQLLGIIMASGIPLTHIKNQNIKTPYNFKSDILSYTLNSGLQIQTYSLICSNKISRCIENLDKNRLLSIGADKINYVAKNIFDFRITTKKLRIIHSLIARSKETLHEIRYNSHSQNFFLVKTPCILHLYQKLKYIKSYAPLKLNQNNLNYYRNSSNELTSTITNLISNFFNESENGYFKNLHNLTLYINSNLKNLGIYKNTSKLQKRIISKIFFLD
ncbi:hypothetical protein LRB87_02565 [Borreliella burgdorferi]|uniref:hypothetical protein n=1 Tax=Borreliella burgdorferi TaxID=139 RepID=UPI001E50F75C|nr:hypothetical protein [Borreliella burgdorferi]MCD2416726.1 hypothetical protein [Borreliella burgdorferi]MCD2418766.1 hypothetical protein [Borreliella burgdorferi]